ncbi:MAG: hypothetical protein J6U04_10950 [Salinivirgaceae bacterium]|nr:hypothetical protein [Salinivirgaceae bacterium]
MQTRCPLIGILVLAFALLAANQSVAQRKTKVELVQANAIRSDKNICNGARRLIGNVKFKQDSAIMECDSAHFYSDRNMFDAFGHVHLYKMNNKNMDVRADFLRHDGDLKIAHFRHNVVLRDSNVTLTTDSLDYNLQTDIGYYEHNGRIVDSLTVLTSVKGYYYNKQREVYFRSNVVIDHDSGEYQMFTDTIRYGLNTKVIDFFGPTEFYNDTNYMYARYGWYNTESEQSMFKHDALFRNPSQTIICDSMLFNRLDESGAAYSNVVAIDTVQNLVVKGNYVEIHKEPELLIVTDSALMIYVTDGDSLYLHADTMKMCRDTSGLYRTFSAYWHVRAYKSDLQLQADSIFFSMSDSIAKFFGNPIFWVNENQITTEYMEAFVKDNQLQKFILNKSGMIVSPHDSIHFNQIKGAQMIGYLRNNDLYKVDVFKRAQTLYFPVDDNEIVGVNKGESTEMTIYLKDRKLKRLAYRAQTQSDMYPLESLSTNDMRLSGFVWYESIRPKSPTDIFIWHNNEAATSTRRITMPTQPTNKPTKNTPMAPTRKGGGKAGK